MSERLVVGFRYAAVECDPSHYLTVAKRVEVGISSVGGVLVSWASDRYAFECDPADFRQVLTQVLAMLLRHPEHGVGISQGTLTASEGGHAWGRALVVASALSGAAKPGEVLLDPSLPDVKAGLLATLGRIPVRVGERHLSAALLLPGACPPSGYRADAALEPVVPRPSAPSMAPGSKRLSVFDALRSGDPQTMMELSQALRAENSQAVAAERLEAMALLGQGRAEEGLARLREGVRKSENQSPLQRAQAHLALALGLFKTGHHEEAHTVSLSGYELARESGDQKAHQASTYLLAQLAAERGAHDEARAWQRASYEGPAVKA